MALARPLFAAALRQSSPHQPARYWRTYPNPGPLRLRLLRAVTEPVLEQPNQRSRTEEMLHRHELMRQVRDNNPYRDFLVERAKSEFISHLDTSLVIFLESLYHRRYNEYHFENELFHKGIRIYYDNAVVVRMAAAGTCWESVFNRLSADGPNTAYALSSKKTPEAAKTVLRVLSRCPFWVPLGGAVDGRLLTVAQLTAFAALPDLEGARSQFVGALQQAPLQLLNLLQTPQRRLVAQLEERKQQLSEVKVS